MEQIVDFFAKVFGIGFILFIFYGLFSYYYPKFTHIDPEVWIDNGFLYIKKYLKSRKIDPQQIKEIAMVSKPDYYGSELTVAFTSIILKITLISGEVVKTNKVLYSQRDKQIKEKELPKEIGTDHLPPSAEVKRLVDANKEIKVDEFTKEYIQKSSLYSYIKILNG